MICIMTRYFSYHRILLLTVGLWPYQQSKLVQFQLMLFYSILVSFIVSQLSAFVLAECTIYIVIKILSSALYFTMLLIKYISFRINIENVKQILEKFQHICNELEDKNEINIIKKYGNNSKRYMATIILAYFCYVAVIFSLQIVPIIAGVFVNESYYIKEIFMPVYYVNQEKYFYLLLLHINATVFIGGTVIVATGMMLIGYVIHACGMFRIASYRIEKALMANMVKKVNFKDEIIMYKEIILAIDIQRKAIKFSELLFFKFQKPLFLLITVGVICLSLNFYRISEAMSFEDDINQFFAHLLITASIFMYLFLANYAGQEFTDHNDHIFSTAYNVRWYVAPLHIQKLILFLLLRGYKTVNLRLGGIFILSLEYFATLTKASISYFTVMYSMQQ